MRLWTIEVIYRARKRISPVFIQPSFIDKYHSLRINRKIGYYFCITERKFRFGNAMMLLQEKPDLAPARKNDSAESRYKGVMINGRDHWISVLLAAAMLPSIPCPM